LLLSLACLSLPCVALAQLLLREGALPIPFARVVLLPLTFGSHAFLLAFARLVFLAFPLGRQPLLLSMALGLCSRRRTARLFGLPLALSPGARFDLSQLLP
jgi:hypothetical protein